MRRAIALLGFAILLNAAPATGRTVGGDLLWQDEFAIVEIAANGAQIAAIGTIAIGRGAPQPIVRVYDANTGKRLWQDQASADTIVVDDNRVVIAGGGVVRAYDAKKGGVVWKDKPPFAVTQLYTDGKTTVAVAPTSTTIRVRVYETGNGKIQIADRTVAVTGITLFDRGRAFTVKTVTPQGLVRCQVQAASVATGRLLWETTLPSTCIATNGVTDGKRVYMSGIGGAFPDQFMVRAFDAESGGFLWEHRSGNSAFQDAAVAVDVEKRFVYAVGWNQRTGPGSSGREDFALKALNAETGTIAWEDRYGDAAPFCLCHGSAVVVSAGTVYGVGVVTGGSPTPPPTAFLRAYDAKNGDLRWQQNFDAVEAIAATKGEIAVLTPGATEDDAILRVFDGK